jgi:hypothetical protein
MLTVLLILARVLFMMLALKMLLPLSMRRRALFLVYTQPYTVYTEMKSLARTASKPWLYTYFLTALIEKLRARMARSMLSKGA